MDTILRIPQDTPKEQQEFGPAIKKLQEAIRAFQEKIPPDHYDAILDQLDDIKYIVNDLKSDLMNQNQQLASEHKRFVLWKHSLTNTTCFIFTRLHEKSLREALERLHEKMNQSIHDPLPDPYLMTIGL